MESSNSDAWALITGTVHVVCVFGAQESLRIMARSPNATRTRVAFFVGLVAATHDQQASYHLKFTNLRVLCN